MTPWRGYLQVAMGCALGAVLRGLIGQAAVLILGSAFLWATLAVNALGSWLIGFFAARATYHPHGFIACRYPMLAVGFCGGFTSFSMFGLEVVYLLDTARPMSAVAYAFGSVVVWLIAVWLGQLTARPAAP